MTMTFNAAAAHASTNNARKEQRERIRRTAETHVEQLVEPIIKTAAERGENQVDFEFHYTRAELYKNIRIILEQNGFNASINRENNCLNVKW
jgi:hypothetical protein